jgi:ribosomal protein S18 acetylase RimI-like enzyme
VPLLSELSAVRDILNRDRAWAAYAIGDLDPGFVEHCEWRAPAGSNDTLLLLYRGFSPPIAFAMGTPDEVRALLSETHAPEISLHVQPHVLEAIGPVYVPTFTRQMHRMVVDPDAFQPVPHDDVRALGENDATALSMLYDDGHSRGEGPTFFSAAMLGQGTFRGVWEDSALVAVAGTHLYSRAQGVCAIGNIYTRSDRRGRGLAARVTSAVVAQAISDGVRTIVLNVSRANVTAQRVYERLGFTVYCEFLEGEAHRHEDHEDHEDFEGGFAEFRNT